VDVREPYEREAFGSTRIDGALIVMMCAELMDIEPVALSLEKLNTGSLLTYDHPLELRRNPPLGEIDLFVLIDREFLESTADTLRWLDRNWPHTARAVVGNRGSGRQELISRIGGAIYLVDPVPRRQWQSLVRLAVESANRSDTSAA
jgi:hypothetical protein